MLKLSDFYYNLPRELIAQYPLKERDDCRLLVIGRKNKSIEHRVFKDIGDYLDKGDLLVLNDTKVLPCRLFGRRKSGGKIEVLLLKQKESLDFEAMLKPSRLKLGEKIIFDNGCVTGEVKAKNEIRFEAKDRDSVYKLGVMPLPPYIKRKPELADSINYQTVYAREEGAVAAPTAGLHFTEDLIGKLQAQGINLTYLTLHVGLGTFKPVKSEDITKHKMEPEYFRITESSIKEIEDARKTKNRIIAVGTTSLRVLETYASGRQEGYTDLFIYPGYKFRLTDCLLTNFHLPKTTLFMLVCAFLGESLAKNAYQEAIDKGYRFYSYGDAMLIV